MMSFTNYLPRSWQSWVLLLACILACGFAIILLVGELRADREIGARPTTTVTMLRTRIAFIVLGIVIGWVGRDMMERYTPRPVYHDVLVVARYDAHRYLLQPARMKPYLCEFDTPQDFERGQKMITLGFKQLLGRKHLLYADFCPEYCDSNGVRLNYLKELTNERDQRPF